VALAHTFTHKQYTEYHNETEHTKQNIHNNKNTINITIKYIIYKIKQKHTKHTTIYTMIKKWKPKNVKECDKRYKAI
jgi:hypothetical protein